MPILMIAIELAERVKRSSQKEPDTTCQTISNSQELPSLSTGFIDMVLAYLNKFWKHS